MADDARAHLVALLALPELGPSRLRALLDAFGDPPRAWEAVARGRLDDVPLRSRGENRSRLVGRWQRAAAAIDVEALSTRQLRDGIHVLAPGDPLWPRAFVDDPEPPPLLFVQGDPELLATTSVAVVGTRRCTAAGAATARELGEDLAAAGVGVVSGLAIGIDGAAHHGSLRGGGPTIGVVATGLDEVYPRRHAELWAAVAAAGVLVSEAPLGTKGERWRFPARNRLIAALATVVVVVESALRGGSMLTVESAVLRQRDVMAVPGPVRAPASAGPNQLLAEGCGLVRDATDVLVALGSAAPSSRPPADPAAEVWTASDDDPVSLAVSWPAASLDEIVAATGLPFAHVAARLAALELDGVVERVADGYQRVAR